MGVYVRNKKEPLKTKIQRKPIRIRLSLSLANIGAVSTKTKVKLQTEWFEPHVDVGFLDSYGKFDQRIRDSKNKTGVYLIKEGSKVVYVGMSQSNLYKTLTRHFQQWNARQKVTSYDAWENKYKVKILYTSKKDAPKLECELFQKYKPRDNHDNPCSIYPSMTDDFNDVPF